LYFHAVHSCGLDLAGFSSYREQRGRSSCHATSSLWADPCPNMSLGDPAKLVGKQVMVSLTSGRSGHQTSAERADNHVGGRRTMLEEALISGDRRRSWWCGCPSLWSKNVADMIGVASEANSPSKCCNGKSARTEMNRHTFATSADPGVIRALGRDGMTPGTQWWVKQIEDTAMLQESVTRLVCGWVKECALRLRK